MAKINVRIPEPKKEYDESNQKQINRKKFSTSESSGAPEKSGTLPVPLS